jgi:hypothetical protein
VSEVPELVLEPAEEGAIGEAEPGEGGGRSWDDDGGVMSFTRDFRFVVNLSGGLCSWFAAKRTIEWFGRDRVTLLFADTLIEDPDLYRFLDDCEQDLRVPITRIADGRTPWDIFFKNRFLGNTRVDLCSRILKRELLHKWYEENCDPRRSVTVIGLSYGERDRYERFRQRMRVRGWRVMAPAMAPPHVDKAGMMTALAQAGIALPKLYEEGFPHNNCGGFCVKQGQAGFRLLLQKRPKLYKYHEQKEQEFIKFIGKPVAILHDRQGGTTKPMSLKVFRERVQSGEITQCNDWGGCGCAID